MDLERDGARLFPGAGLDRLSAARQLASALPRDDAGIRLAGLSELRPIVEPMESIAAAALGAGTRPVRAILFDKSARNNWALGWHQDRVICVRERHDVAGYGAWTRKDGLLHVSPPTALLEAMVTLRFHLDDVPEGNGPLLIAPGSHRLGRIAERDIENVVARFGTHACLAAAGDIWAYATLIFHASDRASAAARRRVLQVDFAARDLPPPLEWLGLW